MNANKSSEKMRHTKAASASAGNSSRIAYRVYQAPAVYAAELENVFYGPTWNYVGLSAEIPNVGDWRRTMIGEREVLVVRKPKNQFSILPNVCAHRGSQICQARN